VEIHPENAAVVRRAYELYAYHNHTLDTLKEVLFSEGMLFTDSRPKFDRSKLHTLLTDRAYIGEIRHKGQWYPGTQEPLVDRATWDRVQELLGQGLYRSHQMTYASELIECGHCGCPITGESKTKKTKSGDRE
jgi:site-specific DNA recombinase